MEIWNMCYDPDLRAVMRVMHRTNNRLGLLTVV